MPFDTSPELKSVALAHHEARLEAVRKASGTVRMPVAKTEDLDPLLGQFGGMTAKELNTGGVKYPPNVFLPPELVMQWPLPNRHALQSTGRVSFFSKPPLPEAMQQVIGHESALAERLMA